MRREASSLKKKCFHIAGDRKIEDQLLFDQEQAPATEGRAERYGPHGSLNGLWVAATRQHDELPRGLL